MDYEALYKGKLTTAAKAAEVVKSGDWVDYGWTATTPVAFDQEMAKRITGLHDVKFLWTSTDISISDRAHPIWRRPVSAANAL